VALITSASLLLVRSSHVAWKNVRVVEKILSIRSRCLAGVDVIDLEGCITIAQAALEVKHVEPSTICSTPSSTEKVHDGPKRWKDDILAGVIDGLDKRSVGIVGDASDHLDRLTLEVVKTGSLNVAVSSDKGSLLRRTGEVAEVLAEVVVAGGTGASEERADHCKVCFQISQLPCAAAKVHLSSGSQLIIQVWTLRLQQLQCLVDSRFRWTIILAIEELDLIASNPVLTVRVPATYVVHHTLVLRWGGNVCGGQSEEEKKDAAHFLLLLVSLDEMVIVILLTGFSG